VGRIINTKTAITITTTKISVKVIAFVCRFEDPNFMIGLRLNFNGLPADYAHRRALASDFQEFPGISQALPLA
jgi:hypothetical protein